MSRVPSANVLAKDTIGYAEELVFEESAKSLIRNLGIQYYNQAVMEIFNIVLLISPFEYNNTAEVSSAKSNLTLLSGDKIFRGDLSGADFNNNDEVLSIRCYNGSEHFECFGILPSEINSYFNVGYACYPYENSIVFSMKQNGVDFCFGENVEVGVPVFTVTFRKYPDILTTTNYNSLYMSVADKYHPLLTNRIASYAEIRKGITDNTLQIVKMLYEQMIAPLNIKIQESIKQKLNIGG